MPTSTSVPATVLIVDDSSLCRDMVSKSLHADGLKTVAAVDGFDGLARLGKEHIDAVILDNEMPKMGGLAFLKALRSETKWKKLPVIMLTTTVAKEVIVEATHYGLCGYLLKARLSMPEMLKRVHHALAQSTSPAMPTMRQPPSADALKIPNLVARDATLTKVAQISEARTLSGVVAQIAEVAASAKSGIAEIAAVVKQDPVLAVRIIHLGCSAAYAGSKARIGNIDEAVRVIGVEKVKEMAVSMAVFKAFPASRADGIDLLRCWQHAISVAAIMNRIVLKTDTIPPGFPYMIGLCHDLGEILLRQSFPAEFGAAVDFAGQAHVAPNDLVRNVFGLPYAELTEALFERLKLPAALAAPIKEYQFSSPASGENQLSVMARALSIANYLAHSVQCGSSSECPIAPVTQNDCRTALIPTSAINLSEIRSESITTTCMIAGAGPEQEAALMNPMLPRTEAKIWHIRHRNFAFLDPIEAALRSLCKVECHERLPQGDELASLDGIVAAHPDGSTACSKSTRTHRQSGRCVPVLHLVRTVGQDDPAGQAYELRYPTSLNQLGKYLSTLMIRH